MVWNPFRARREREEQELVAMEEFRFLRKLTHEDVTVFGERLTELHVDTMTTALDEDMRRDYQKALDLHDEARAGLAAAEIKDVVLAVNSVLEDGRFHLACVLARRADEEPDVRQVRVGDRYVAWHTAGGAMSNIADHRAHVLSGADTRLTDKHIAEAHLRAALNSQNGPGGPGMGGPLG